VKCCARILFIGTLLQFGACAANINDLRLEGVVPIAGRELPPTRFTARDPQSFGGVVAEFSTERDMRRQVARFGGNFSAVVERCGGRTHIEDSPPPRLWISHGDFGDESGVLAEAGSASAIDSRRIGAASGVPQHGRFLVWLPVHLEGYATERPSDVSGWVTRRVVAQDLLSAPDDLCIFARGASLLHGVWRSNTVIIPYEAIRVALESSPTPSVFPASR